VAEPNTLLAERYRLVRQVGSGGMGVVWEAWDERLERPVAVKQLKPQPGLSPEEAELGKSRAMREARITARLHHRNAVPVFDVVEHEGQPCLIMQFLPSVPLSAVLKEGGPLGVDETSRVGAQVASALASAHQLGIVHRDVKPGNILIADDGTALISDFGISHALGDATLTSTGLVHGTPAYLAPEVARGADSSFASDVFSLGATLYASLEGGPPFGTDSNSIALLYRVASGEFAPPQRAGELTSVLMDMLRSDPAARPDMKEAAARLAAVEARASTPTATFPAPTLPLPLPTPTPTPSPGAAAAPGPTRTGPWPEETSTTQVRRDVAPAAFAAPATSATRTAAAGPAAAPAAAAPVVPPTERDQRRGGGGRRRGGWVLAALALLVALVAGSVLVYGQLGRRGDSTAADPSTTRAAPSASTTGTSDPGSGSSDDNDPSPAEPSSDPPSPSATRTTRSPSATPTPTPTSKSDRPTAAQLEDVITTYYGLVPDDTDRAWPMLTANYQRTTSGGRQSYEQFWKQVDRVSVSKVKADPPSTVVATVTYRRGGQVAVERTSFRLVEDDGVLKIAGSSVLGAG
jgi:serine/threonine protein kinase